MEHIGNGYTAYSANDLLQLIKEAERLDGANLLETLLIVEGFTCEDGNRYSGKDPKQIIELISDEKGMSYANKLLEADQGELIQFIQNTLMNDQFIIPNDDFNIFLSAVQVALHLEEKQRTKQIKIPHLNQRKKGKGRGI